MQFLNVTATPRAANVAWDLTPTRGATHTMPDEYELESATNLAVTLAWVAGAVVVAYLVTGGEEVVMSDGTVLSADAVHWVSAGLTVFYILATIAILLMLLSGIKKLIK